MEVIPRRALIPEGIRTHEPHEIRDRDSDNGQHYTVAFIGDLIIVLDVEKDCGCGCRCGCSPTLVSIPTFLGRVRERHTKPSQTRRQDTPHADPALHQSWRNPANGAGKNAWECHCAGRPDITEIEIQPPPNDDEAISRSGMEAWLVAELGEGFRHGHRVG
jgi:hypothetical protein